MEVESSLPSSSPHENRNVRAVIFDMDDTLYSCHELRMRFRKAAWLLISQTFHLTEAQGKEKYHRVRECLTEVKGYSPSNWDILIHLGISEGQWISQSIQSVDPGQFLQKDNRLIGVLNWLKKRCRLGILTNNNLVQAERIVSALGISDLINVIHGATEGGYRKPDLQPFRQIIRDLGCSTDQCLMVGDDLPIDLIPACNLGMATYHVSGVTDVYHMNEVLDLFTSSSHKPCPGRSFDK